MAAGRRVRGGAKKEQLERQVSEQKLPRGVQIEPSLRAEPACWQGRNVQQGVPAGADHFCSIPTEEGLRGEPNSCRMRYAAEADRTPLTLIHERPPETEEAEQEVR